MAFWMTTHWPPRIDEDPSASPGVWVVEGRQHIIARVAPGDLVWLYQSAQGRTVRKVRADGTVELVPCLPGRQGIVALLEVTDAAFARDDIEPEEYTDGTRAWWRWYAPTKTLTSAGFVPRQVAASIFGYKDSYVFRGFGHEHSGLMQIGAAVFQRIRQTYAASSEGRDDERLAATEAAARRGGPGGEGEIHKRMKELIAADPARVLGETGLQLVRMEYPFPTGDRIDVVLKDEFGRYVVVEVEPDCAADELAGPLQCMKYRALLAYVLGRPVAEVRSILVSRTIHADVRNKCQRYEIDARLMNVTVKGG